MHVAEIELYEILKSKIGKKEAKTLVEYIETKVDKNFDEKKDFLATKQDISSLEMSTKQEIANLEIKIETTRADLIKWMFLFWIGQIATIAALIRIFFKP